MNKFIWIFTMLLCIGAGIAGVYFIVNSDSIPSPEMQYVLKGLTLVGVVGVIMCSIVLKKLSEPKE